MTSPGTNYWTECVNDEVEWNYFRCIDSGKQISRLERCKPKQDEEILKIILSSEHHGISIFTDSDDEIFIDVIEEDYHSGYVRKDKSVYIHPDDVQTTEPATTVNSFSQTFVEGEIYFISLEGRISKDCRAKNCTCYTHLIDDQCDYCDDHYDHSVRDAEGGEYCSVDCLNEANMEKHV